MPPKDTTFDTEFGQIRCGGSCKDDYGRIIAFQNRAGQILKLQRAAADSLEAVETKLGFAVKVTGAHRACAYQAELYASDPNRFADPSKTGHTRGLAIDVDTGQSWLRRKRIGRQLAAKGWHQSRPTDEPWHYSYGIQV